MTTADLQELFQSETRHFKDGMSKGLPFNELKAIRVTLREITIEINNRSQPDQSVRD